MKNPRHRLAIPATLTVIALAGGGGCTSSSPPDTRDAFVDVAMETAVDVGADVSADGAADARTDVAIDAPPDVPAGDAGDAGDVAADDTPSGITCDPPTVDADGGGQCGPCYNPDHSRNGCANCRLSDGVAHVLC